MQVFYNIYKKVSKSGSVFPSLPKMLPSSGVNMHLNSFHI